MKTPIALALFFVLVWQTPSTFCGEGNAEWQHIGHANQVVAMTAAHGKLFAANSYNALWRRDPVPRDVRWQAFGHANRVLALAATDGTLFGVTADQKLWMRSATTPDVPWRHIGYADGAVALTTLGGKLYAATRDRQLLVGKIDPWNIRWQRLSEGMQIMALASLDGKLFAITNDHKLWMREPSGGNVPWQFLSEGVPIATLAGVNGKLFGTTKDNKLWMRSLPEALQIVEISLEPPDWLRLPDAHRKAAVSMTFNREVTASLLSIPTGVTVDLRTLTSGRTAAGVRGSLQPSENPRMLVFISDRTMEELVRPQPGELIEYRVTLRLPESAVGVSEIPAGSGAGENVEKDAQGRVVRLLQKPYAGPQPSEGRVF